MNNKKKAGFTLIELLVVISIIGFLLSAAVYAINEARLKSRNTARLATIKNIQRALDLYYDKYKQYPPTSATTNYIAGNPTGEAPCYFMWCKTGYAPGTNTLGKYLEEFIGDVPLDPLGKKQTTNRYFYESDKGDNYQTYGLATMLEYKNANNNDPMYKMMINDGGQYTTWYEVGEQPMRCKKIGPAFLWWEAAGVDDETCQGATY